MLKHKELLETYCPATLQAYAKDWCLLLKERGLLVSKGLLNVCVYLLQSPTPLFDRHVQMSGIT